MPLADRPGRRVAPDRAHVQSGLTGFTLPKLLWVRDHKPEIWNRVRTVLLPKDYVRLKLTGDHATDVADASGTLMFNVAERCWSDAILETTQIDRAWLPSTHEGPDVTGRIRAEVAADTGLSAGTLVVAGGGDQAAGAVGMGSVTPGAVSVTIGTSGVVFASTDHPALDPSGRVHTFCHVVPGHWHVMGVTQAAGCRSAGFAIAPRQLHVDVTIWHEQAEHHAIHLQVLGHVDVADHHVELGSE